jgi:prevent-host-death family protein
MNQHDVVGIRELKSGLSEYIRLVREGRSLVITDRGRPVAEIMPIKTGSEVDAILRKLAAEGRVALPSRRRLPSFRPIKSRGRPSLADVISEDREDRV